MAFDMNGASHRLQYSDRSEGNGPSEGHTLGPIFRRGGFYLQTSTLDVMPVFPVLTDSRRQPGLTGLHPPDDVHIICPVD